jgi:hypothetical protein
MSRNDTAEKKDSYTDKVFFIATVLVKLFFKNNQVKIDMDKAENAPTQYLAHPISYICFTHSANLNFKIVKIRCVLINGEMQLWEVEPVISSVSKIF